MPSDRDDPAESPDPERAPTDARPPRSGGRDADGERERKILLTIAAVAALTFLYSVLVVQQILAWFGVVIPLLVLYLLWRFVRAHERVADALESGR